MKKCGYCGKEHGDEAVTCMIDGQPLIAASPEILVASKPADFLLGANWTEQQFLWAELALVCFIAFGQSIVLSFQTLFAGGLARGQTAGGYWTYYCMREAGALALVWFLLARRSQSFSNLGLRWSWKQVGWSVLLYISGTIIFRLAYYLFYWVARVKGYESTTLKQVGHYFTGTGVPVMMFLFQFVNAFFEELIVRAYVMIQIKQLTGSIKAAILISAALQTSYHLYQGLPLALAEGVMFLWFSFYYAKTNKILPLILAHLYADLYATAWYSLRPQ